MSDTPGSPQADAVRMLRHDLRTPVNHIVGYADLLQEETEDLPPEVLEGLGSIRGEMATALSLIDELARAATGEDAPASATPASRALSDLASGIAARAGTLRAGQEAAGKIETASDLGKIHAAALRLYEMVAARFTAPRATLSDREALQALIAGPAARILVVDDNEMNRDMLTRRLGRLGYETLQAENGQEALELLEAQPVDLLLLDIMMPGLDGYAVLERRQAEPRLQEIPVIMISAVDEIESVARCITLGAEDYLPKPFNPVLLKARVEATLERKRRRDVELASLRQLAVLTEAATAVEAGTFDPTMLAPIAAVQGPIGHLATVVVRMAGAVREREAQLRAELKERSYVFLSYARADRQKVEEMVGKLQEHGIRVWVDRHEIAAGSTWSAQIVQSIRGCAAMLIACTPAAMSSPNVRQEIQLAWNYSRPYVPLILETTEFPDDVMYQLVGCQWVDVLKHNDGVWMPPLLQALQLHGIAAGGAEQ